LEFKRNSHQSAEKLYLRALKIYVDRIGENHPDTAQAQYNIGEFYVRTSQYVGLAAGLWTSPCQADKSVHRKQKAIPYYELALQTFRNIHGPQHQKVINILARLA